MKRFESFKKSLDSLAEAKERDKSDSFVLSGTSAKFSITFDLMKDTIEKLSLTGEYYGTDQSI